MKNKNKNKLIYNIGNIIICKDDYKCYKKYKEYIIDDVVLHPKFKKISNNKFRKLPGLYYSYRVDRGYLSNDEIINNFYAKNELRKIKLKKLKML